jgi:glycosyltransferase involved in cell wall biosynthesis
MGRESIQMKILYVSDFDLQGSGYLNISIPICKGLAEYGHDVRVIGMNYAGNEHKYPFSILSCKDFKDAHAMIYNLSFFDKPDVVIISLDIPHHGFFIDKVTQLNLKYICITPLENPPLTMSWAAPLLNANAVFFISEMGAQAAKDAGIINAKHIQIGIDTEAWRPPKEQERETLRANLDVKDKFVILTVADNQERKNLWAALEIVARLKKGGINNLKYFLITREHVTFGWRLRDLAIELGINDEVTIIEKGLPFDKLWGFYACADLFLLTSKAEGLGLPILEAMACGVPILATHTGAIPEILDNGRGFTVPPIYTFRDVWGNAKRDLIDIDAAVKVLRELMEQDLSDVTNKAREFVKSRTWDIPVKQLIDEINEVTND